MKNAQKKAAAPKAGGYRFLAILFFLLAAGGLFLGLLSQTMQEKFPLLSLGAIYQNGTIAYSGDILKGSLLGVVWGVIWSVLSWFKNPNLANFNLFAHDNAVMGPRSWNELILSCVLLVLILLLAITVVLSLVFMIVSLVSGKSAKRCATASGVLTLISYGGLFLLGYAASCGLNEKFHDAMFDFPTMAIAGVTLVLLFFTALAQAKGRGLVNFLNFAITAVALFALCYPSSQPARLLGTLIFPNIFDMASGANMFVAISLGVFLGLLGFNLFIGAIRMNAKRGFLFDVVRYSLQLIAAVLVMVAFLVHKDLKAAVFAHDLWYTIIMLAAALLPVLLSIILMATAGKKKQKATAPAKATEEEDPGFFEYGNDDDDEDIAEDIADNEVHRYIHHHRPAPAAPAAESAPAPSPAPAPEPAPQPIYQPNIIVQAPVEEKKPPREKTEFERRMEAIARDEAAFNPPSPFQHQQQQQREPMAANYPPVYAAPQYTKKYPMQQMQIEDDQISPYIAGHYDPFLSKLTSQEVSEFGDLFISNKYGMQNYLPVYVIGGDNDEFFNKVFIYLGRFRNYISSDLLEKLNVFVSAVRLKK